MAAPMVLSPVVFAFLAAPFELNELTLFLGLCLAAMVVRLFRELYAGLWSGRDN